MVNQALFDVVKNQLAIGVSDQEVREFLRRRGTSEIEMQELFEALASQSVTIRDIPVPPALPQTQDEVSLEQAVPQVVVSPAIPVDPVVAEMPAQSEAHGIVRDVPPLQPSAPFAPISDDQRIAAQSIINTSTSVAPSVAFADQEAVPSNRKKPFLIAVAAFIGLVAVILGGYFVYSSYFASPEAVMDTMISRLRDVRSGEFLIDMTTVTDSMSELASTSTSVNPFLKAFAIQGPVTVTMHASGTVNLLDAQRPKVAIAFSAAMDKWPMGDFVLGGEYRNSDRVNYVKVDDVPDLGFLSLSFLKHKWFKVADSETKTQLGVGSSDSRSPVISIASQDQLDRFAAAWKANRFLVVEKVLDSENIDGVSTHHYAITFNKEAFKKLDAEANIIFDRGDTVAEVAAFEEDLRLVTVNNLELWIGKRDGLPHKVTMNVSLQDKANASKKTEVTLTMMGNKFNTALDIATPEGAQSIEEAIKGVFGQMLGGAAVKKPAPTTLKDRNDRRKSDVILIADAIRKNITTNKGSFVCAAGPLPSIATFMGVAGFGMNGYAIEPCLVPTYLNEMPRDPSKGTATMTGYSVLYSVKTKKVTVRASYAEESGLISVTR